MATSVRPTRMDMFWTPRRADFTGRLRVAVVIGEDTIPARRGKPQESPGHRLRAYGQWTARRRRSSPLGRPRAGRAPVDHDRARGPPAPRGVVPHRGRPDESPLHRLGRRGRAALDAGEG